jgi:hypothetical protein
MPTLQERTLNALFGALGVNPAEMQAAFKYVIGVAKNTEAEVASFKAGVQRTVPDLFARMERMEAKLDYLIARDRAERAGEVSQPAKETEHDGLNGTGILGTRSEYEPDA